MSAIVDDSDPVEQGWTVLHGANVEDLVSGVAHLDRLARALRTAVHHGYVANAELIPTPEVSLADARMVARLVEHTETWVNFVAQDLDVIRSKVAELLRLAEEANR